MNTDSPRIGAVLLAGGHVPASLSHLCAHRALLRIRDRYLLEHLLDTLQQVPSITATALVAPEEALKELATLPMIPVASGTTIVDNMQRGATALLPASPTHLLFITGDIPLVTATGLEEYIQQSVASTAALTYPIIPREASEQRFPGAKRTYVKIHEGTFTGGNVIFTEMNLLDDKHALIQQLYTARKNPVKLAKILGWSTIVRMLSGQLTITYLEGVASRIMGAPIRAIITRHAEIGFDVDKIEDLHAVERAIIAEVTHHEKNPELG